MDRRGGQSAGLARQHASLRRQRRPRATGRPNEDGHFYYGRRGAPTQWALAEALTELEPGAAGTVLYPSGVAAIAGALLAVLESGDTLLMTDNAYEPSRTMAQGPARAARDRDAVLRSARHRRLRGAVRRAHPGGAARKPGQPDDGSAPTSPRSPPSRASKGAVSLLDNTWASPLGFPALERGCDIAIMSLTKHVGGHSDLMMGCGLGRARSSTRRLRPRAQALGQVVSPDDAALALRGLRTLGVRLERETASALDDRRVARRPARSRPRAVPDAARRARATSCGSAISPAAAGCSASSSRAATPARRARFIDALELFGIGYSLGRLREPGRSRSIPPAPAAPPPGRPPAWNPDDRLGVRLSIGLEDPGDLMRDLERGFAAMARRVSEPRRRRDRSSNVEPRQRACGVVIAHARPLGLHRRRHAHLGVDRAGRDRRHRPGAAAGAARRSGSPAGCSPGSPRSTPAQRLLAQKLISIAIWIVAVPDRRSTSSAST